MKGKPAATAAACACVPGRLARLGAKFALPCTADTEPVLPAKKSGGFARSNNALDHRSPNAKLAPDPKDAHASATQLADVILSCLPHCPPAGPMSTAPAVIAVP